MLNLRLAFRYAVSDAVRDDRRRSLAGAGHRRELGDLLDVQPDASRSLPVSRAGAAGQPRRAGPNPGSQSCTERRRLRRSIQLSNVSRSRGGTHRVQRRRGASLPSAPGVAYHNQTLNGDAMLRVGIVLRRAWAASRRSGGSLPRTTTRPSADTTSPSCPIDFWQTKLGANPNIVNDKIIINGQMMTIIGVAPKGFEERHWARRQTCTCADHDATRHERRTNRLHAASTRTGYISLPGSSPARRWRKPSQPPTHVVHKPIINDVEAPLQDGMSAATMVKFRAKEIALADGRRGSSSMHAQTRSPLILLLSITAIVLVSRARTLPTCLLARAAGRTTEMAVRLSLGGTRRQLLSQLLTRVGAARGARRNRQPL